MRTIDHVIAYLKANGPTGTRSIAAATGLKEAPVKQAIAHHRCVGYNGLAAKIVVVDKVKSIGPQARLQLVYALDESGDIAAPLGEESEALESAVSAEECQIDMLGFLAEHRGNPFALLFTGRK